MTEIKIVLVGVGGVGKSALTITYVSNVWVPEYDPTIEDSHRKQVTVDEIASMLEILDTAGQEEYSSMQDQWFRSGQGFVLVYSIVNRKSYRDVKHLYEKILRIKDAKSVPIVLVANKCDLIDTRDVTTQEGQSLANELGCPYFEASAKIHVNVDEAFQELVRIIRRARAIDNPTNGQLAEVDANGAIKKKKGCAIL